MSEDHKQLKYSRQTLRPYDKNERERFLKFRKEEIMQSFSLFVGIQVARWTPYLAAVLYSPSKFHFEQLAIMTIFLLSNLIVLLLGKYSNSFNYFLPLMIYNSCILVDK